MVLFLQPLMSVPKVWSTCFFLVVAQQQCPNDQPAEQQQQPDQLSQQQPCWPAQQHDWSGQQLAEQVRRQTQPRFAQVLKKTTELKILRVFGLQYY